MVLALILCATLGAEPEPAPGLIYDLGLRAGYVAGLSFDDSSRSVEDDLLALRGVLLQAHATLRWRRWLGVSFTASTAILGRPTMLKGGLWRGEPVQSGSLDAALVMVPLAGERFELWGSLGTGVVGSNGLVMKAGGPPLQREFGAGPVLAFDSNGVVLQARMGTTVRVTPGFGVTLTAEARTCDWAFAGETYGTFCSTAFAICAGSNWRF